jgi:dTDP-4-dehydrorhamnose reductase
MRRSLDKVLLFGSHGQLGSELRRATAAGSIELIAVPRSDADISDRRTVRELVDRHNPAVVVNAAAYTRVDDAEENRAAAERSNIDGPGSLAETCHAAAIPLIHISTDYVFNGEKQDAYVETDPVVPIGFYGMTKARGEQAVRDACAHHAILRVSWLYGEFGQNFLKTMLRLARKRDVVRVVADQRGSPTSTRELARAILHIAPQLLNNPDKSGIYHFAGEGVTTWHGFASAAIETFCELTERTVKVEPITTAEFPTKTKRPVNSALDCSKFDASFGFNRKSWRSEVREIAGILVCAGAATSSGRDQVNA